VPGDPRGGALGALRPLDPIINIIANPTRPEDRMQAERYRLSQYAAWDMIAGRLRPELGGRPEYLDVVGADYYVHNQWIHRGKMLPPSHPQHLPLRYMLRELYNRYRRPVIIAETGIEADARRDWLRYISREALGRALSARSSRRSASTHRRPSRLGGRSPLPERPLGLRGPVWKRPIDAPFAEELARQQRAFAAGPAAAERIAAVGESLAPEEQEALDRAARVIDEEDGEEPGGSQGASQVAAGSRLGITAPSARRLQLALADQAQILILLRLDDVVPALLGAAVHDALRDLGSHLDRVVPCCRSRTSRRRNGRASRCRGSRGAAG
jgi:hypothetical protein